MWDNGKELKEQLVLLEKMKVGIMKQINLLNENKDAVIPTKVYPTAAVEPLLVNGYEVFRFSYDGMLPHEIEDAEYNKIISDFYFHTTMSAYDFEEYEDVFDEAFIIYCQYFNDSVIRDLDNRNKKFVQDAIRHTRLIEDDNWKHVSNISMGFSDVFNHTQVYVVDKANVVNFMEELLANHNEYKKVDNFLLNKQSFIETCKKEEKDNDESNLKSILKDTEDSFL